MLDSRAGPRRALAPRLGKVWRQALPRGLRSALLLLAAGTVLSCSFDYGESLAEDLAERTPNAVFNDFAHTVVQDNEPVLRLNADRAEYYDKKTLVRLYGVRFTELREGKTLAFGSADEAVLNTETEDAEFFGSVNLRSEVEGVRIQTEYLSWKADERTLESGPDQVTEIERDDGSRIRGAGFRSDARRKAFYFTGDVEGVLAHTQEEGSE